jgi:hypothetical protein
MSQAINPNLTSFAGPHYKGKLIHYIGVHPYILSLG